MHSCAGPNIGFIASIVGISVSIVFDGDIESNHNVFHDGSFKKLFFRLLALSFSNFYICKDGSSRAISCINNARDSVSWWGEKI